jgi:carbonic anhydrase/acetyltransferase-like protein (isoleucine patch superfamily)
MVSDVQQSMSATMPIYAFDGRRPQLPEQGRYWIAPDAHIIGDVAIGEDVSIWFGAVLRGDNETIAIGSRANIQEGALLHTDPGFPLTVGADVTVGHHAILHGCSVGELSLIGMGAIVLNGAKIGARCLVGANALVTEGKTFADNSVIVGAPAKVVRPVDDAILKLLRDSAPEYVERWRRYAKCLEQIS